MITSRKLFGFSLIELLMAIAVVAILSAIAYPSYIKQGQKSKRADAKTALLDLATRQERYFSINNTYTNVGTDLGYSSVFPVNVGGSGIVNYQLSVPSASATAFAGSAAPQGGQATDACGTYGIASNGATSNSGNTAPTASCW